MFKNNSAVGRHLGVKGGSSWRLHNEEHEGGGGCGTYGEEERGLMGKPE